MPNALTTSAFVALIAVAPLPVQAQAGTSPAERILTIVLADYVHEVSAERTALSPHVHSTTLSLQHKPTEIPGRSLDVSERLGEHVSATLAARKDVELCHCPGGFQLYVALSTPLITTTTATVVLYGLQPSAVDADPRASPLFYQEWQYRLERLAGEWKIVDRKLLAVS